MVFRWSSVGVEASTNLKAGYGFFGFVISFKKKGGGWAGLILRSEAPPLFLLSIAGDSLPFSSFGGMGGDPHNRFSDYFKKRQKVGKAGNAETHLPMRFV